MKKILLIAFCLAATSLSAWAQEEVKVLKMTAVRTTGQNVEMSLYDDANFWGPVLNKAEDRLVIDGRSLTLSRVKEIRFSIVTEIVDGITEAEQQPTVAHIYGMDGRLVRRDATTTEGLPKGMYIMNGKKVVVK
ncbi:MAG: hypothetical protein J6S11_06330 [Bacteroidaceae bacterium]|jgi:hypothetical protein|nr:hypothetical protein [Bacteroidaceae bacterium]MBO7266552.1 hypothetical protein [Bacteroidaceae bacterium]